MRLSVISVTKNVEATIRHTLDSFCAQTHHDKELLVIDGASIDQTVEIAKSYATDGVSVLSEPDHSLYEAMNKGLRRYTGAAVGMLNGDDAFHDEHALSRLAVALENADVAHGHLDYVSDHTTKRVVRCWRAGECPQTGFRSGWMPAHPTLYVRRHVVDVVGAYDVSLPTAADYDWMVRAIECHSFRLVRVPHILVDMHHGGRSTVNLAAHIRHNLEALRARRRWLGTRHIDYALFAKPVRKIGQLFTRNSQLQPQMDRRL